MLDGSTLANHAAVPVVRSEDTRLVALDRGADRFPPAFAPVAAC